MNRLLLDTHSLLWWWLDTDRRVGASASEALADGSSAVFVSAASLWEITTKYRIGKLGQAERIISQYPVLMSANDFVPLSISDEHGMRAGLLEGPHRDPFDRIIAAQALLKI